MNFVQLMSPVKVLELFCIFFEAVYASCVLAVVPSTSSSAGTPHTLTWKGHISWQKVVVFDSEQIHCV